MPAYTPNPAVLIDGVSYIGDTLNGVSITTGRTSVDEQPRAGYCTITLITFDNDIPVAEIDHSVQVEIDDTTGNPVVIFAGFVSDIERSIQSYGSVGFATTTRITGVGSLARLNRRLVGGTGFAKEFDGDRILNIIQEATAERWEDSPAGVAWQDIDPTLTWNTYNPYIGSSGLDTYQDTNLVAWNNIDPSLFWFNYDPVEGGIDTPGQYEIVAYSSGETNAFNLAGQVANSARGVLYEGRDGRLNYTDSASRSDYVATYGFTTIPTNVILASNLSSIERMSDLANDVTVIYKNNQTVSDTNAGSISEYGQLAVSVSTLLEEQAAAEAVLDLYLTTRGYPRRSLSAITIPLQLDSMANGLRDFLIKIHNGVPLEINPPDTIYVNNFAGFVEGISWTINRYEAFLTLYLTEYALSVLAQNWDQVSPLEAWNTVSGTLDWANAQVVA